MPTDDTQTAPRRGRGRPKTGTIVNVRIPDDTLALIDAKAAARDGASRADEIRRLAEAVWLEPMPRTLRTQFREAIRARKAAQS